MSDKDPSAQIMAAARKRFLHFGYGKTSMAEIAGDCGMSPGNLYRFFPGKLDIAEAIATADCETQLDHLRRLIARPGLPATQKLRDFLFEGLRRRYARQEKDARAFDLARIVAAEKPEFSNNLLERERRIIVAVLDEGQQAEEFQISDRDFTAEIILSATLKFRHPPLWSKATLARLEQELDGLFRLLAGGLSQKPPARARSEETV